MAKKKSVPTVAKAGSRRADLPRKTKRTAAPSRSRDLFPVVGVGASAGGLEPLTAFLKALSANIGMAIVIVQHLAPQHESALTQLLSRATALPVREVIDGVTLQPDHVYVIPPDKIMTVRGPALSLIPREHSSTPSHPIDDFFSSLAHERGTAAIGIVLSGSGADGTLGLKAIKSEGGITFAQNPKTAAWTAMPASAIAAGAADFILAPAAIAAELAQIARNPYLSNHAKPLEGSDLQKIYALLRAVTAVDFALYKQQTVMRRIERRLTLRRMASVGDYAKFLAQNAAEVKALADDIFIHVTGFFRDPDCFQALRKLVLPTFRFDRRSEPVRVWVPGCSTGEEVYSLAMLLVESLGENVNQIQIQMFGTDIAEPAIERARAGFYSEPAVRGVSAARLRRFFRKGVQDYQINKDVRSLCIFARHDLAKDPPFSKLDLISCRNALIYAGAGLQRRILSAFHYALKPSGFLFLGKSESISGYSDFFVPEDRTHKIFSRKSNKGLVSRLQWRFDGSKKPGFTPPAIAAPGVAPDFPKRAEQALLRRYAPPAVAVDSDFRMLHLQGDVSPYLILPTGPPSVQLLKMLRPEFLLDLRKTAAKALREGVAAETHPIQFDQNGRPAMVRLEVSPLSKRDAGRPDLLVVFKVVPVAEPPAGQRSPPAKTRHPYKNPSIERELATTREYLASVIADQETAQEQMTAAHEELLSSSEELQSTNEELETAKEELQSSNEELLTLNEELQRRNLDLGTLTSDLNHVLAGVEIPVLVLDRSLHIRRFTPAAGKLLNLIETDIGRPFDDIASVLDVPDWDALFAEVIRQGRVVEKEVRDRKRRWYSLRIRPYHTPENKIEGVILTLFDTDTIQRDLVESRDYAHVLFDSAEQAIVAAGTDSRIVLVNSATEKMFGYRSVDLLAKPMTLVLPAPSQGRRSDGSLFPAEVHLSTVDQAGVKLTVAFITDNTGRRLMETQIRALASQLLTAQEEERRRVSRELHVGLCQKLAALALDVESLAASSPRAGVRVRLQELAARAVSAAEEARHIAYELHPSVLDDLGLMASLRALCREFSKAEKVRVRFKAGKLPDLIPQDIASGLYRITEEGLRNVAKHAGAKHLIVGLAQTDKTLMLTLEDDGIGFAPADVKGKGGLGLVSIGERTRIMGGTVSIESKRRRGTRISVIVPLP